MFSSEHRFTEEDLKAIEERMLQIAGRDIRIVREEMPRVQAIEYFRTVREDPYKVEILTDTLKETETVSLYHEDGFTDLCSGPHLFSTAALKAVSLSTFPHLTGAATSRAKACSAFTA